MNKELMLTGHFFKRFFDNDTLSTDGDTQTSVARALCMIAVPELAVSCILFAAYAAIPLRPFWATITDHYFFVLYSFVAMGAVAIFEWEMLFPDRMDFLILSPLPLTQRQMLTAKARALAIFLGLFLLGGNIIGMVLLPAASGPGFWRHVYAHSVAVLMAGTFAALLFLALGGVLLCVLKASWFRVVSPGVQWISVTALAVLLLLLPLFTASLQTLLEDRGGFARFIPPFWFLGVYERLLYGSAAPEFAGRMAREALWAMAIAAIVVLLTYPLAWKRMRRMALEGAARRGRQRSGIPAKLLHRTVVRRPQERAIFHFIGQTMARNHRYQIFLAFYGGVGIALAMSFALDLHRLNGAMHFALSQQGMHAITPLLMFWTVAGLRAAFASPMTLQAGWIYRMTGVRPAEYKVAVRNWVLLAAALVMACILVVLRMCGWTRGQLIVQAGCGLCLALLLVSGFFFFRQSVPFNRPRLPGRTSLPVMLTLYVGVLPPFLFMMIDAERGLERHPLKLLPTIFGMLLVYILLEKARAANESEIEDVGDDAELFQRLGLTDG